MGFAFRPDMQGRSAVHLTDEPDYIVPLKIAPLSLEDCLKEGRWLVVSMSVWSTHDMRAGHHAVEIVKRHGGLIKLGLRPFDYPDEHVTWVLGLGAGSMTEDIEIIVTTGNQFRQATIQGLSGSSPVWVAFIEGEVLSVQRGQLTGDMIEGMINQLLKSK